MISFASEFMEERAKYINHELVNEINYRFRVVANDVLTTMRAMMTDNKNLVESIRRHDNLSKQELTEDQKNILTKKLPGHYQQFIETREALRHIVKLLKKLIKDNQAYKVNTEQDIENYEKNRVQMKEEYIKKINDVETERRYAYYNDYNLDHNYNYRTLNRMLKNTEDIELKMIKHELKRRCRYYDEDKLEKMLKQMELNRDADGLLYDIVLNKFSEKRRHRHDDQDQNQEVISDSVSLNSIPDSFEDPVDLPILERVLPFNLYSSKAFNFATNTATSRRSSGSCDVSCGPLMCIPVGGNFVFM